MIRKGMKKSSSLLLLMLFLCLLVSVTNAHEVRPAYLEIKELEAGSYDVFWKVPVRGTMRLKIEPVLPDHFENVSPPEMQVLSDAIVKQWQIRSGSGGLEGETISIDGLSTTITDVLVRIAFLDDTSHSVILRPEQSSFQVPQKGTPAERALTYLDMGVEHILLGVDHLLFVLGLLLLVNGRWLLVKTITSFTVGHSISLALATLGFVYVPPQPLNAAIALSIVFLGAELVRAQRGELYLTARYPWIIAFGFGLLHGLGFATALTALGLPPSEIPVALLFFNIGVEAGQLLFIAFVFAMLFSYRRLKVRWPEWGRPVPAYTIGSVAAFWFIGRVIVMF